MYIESITEKLNNPNLHNPDNDGYKIIDGCIAEYLEHYTNHIYDLFLTTAGGGYLDLHGQMYGIYRGEGESDESLRKRILDEERLVQSTPDFLSVDVVLWVYFTDILDKNVLSSRNTFLKGEHTGDYVFLGTGDDSSYISSRFVIGDILWE